MSFEVDRSSWAHIALCADLTWATEPPDEFVIANQRLWAQHCRVSQVLQETTLESQSLQSSQCDITDKRSVTNHNQENGSSSRRSVKDVIPESRLAQYYGNFYYDEVRERCYSSPNEKLNFRGYNGQGCENTDLTECWMLPEVEYWFRKLLDDPSDRSMLPRRRRQYRMLPDEDFHISAVSERWGPRGARGEEAALAARVCSVRGLWGPSRAELTRELPRAELTRELPRPELTRELAHAELNRVELLPRSPSPPPAPRKIRARRRQPRRLTALPPPPPAYCRDITPQLFCDPTCKFQFESPRPPQLTECQRAMGRLTASVQAAIRASTARCPPYRGTNVSRYAPTGQRPARCQDRRHKDVWWPRDHPKLDHRFVQNLHKAKPQPETTEEQKTPEETELKAPEITESETTEQPSSPQPQQADSESLKEKVVVDSQVPSTSSAATEGLRQKRLYSTVLSMSAPAPLTLTPVGCVRLQKLTPGILKLNPKIVLPSSRIRPPNVDHKFEELEKEALEQYKASDESIDTKFQELEKQAEEQYSTSNSNTSCSSGNSAEKRPQNCPDDTNTKHSAKFHKEKTVDSVVIYSQNFPDLNAKQTSSVMNLKNFHGPPRGEKKESHRTTKTRVKCEQRAASDTDYEARECVKSHKGQVRWSVHAAQPKKRHMTVCVSDLSSDEDMDEPTGSIKDAGPRVKNRAGKMKLSAHGGGDLHPIMRKT